jgi:hypothetical protein
MTAGGASAELLTMGRKVIALLVPKVDALAAASADGDASATSPKGGAIPVPASDELQELVDEIYGKVDDLQHVFGRYVESALGSIARKDAGASPAELLEQSERQGEDLLESVRSLSLLIGPRYPISIADDGTSELTDKAKEEAHALLESLETTRATEWGVYATLKAAVNGMATWLSTTGDENFKPSRKSVAVAYDIVTATVPLVARMAAFAEEARIKTLDKYYAGEAPEWELPAENDVPLADALGVLAHALDAHIVPAEALLTGGRHAASSAGAHYSPSASAIDALCRALKVVVAASGKDAVAGLANTGVIGLLLRFLLLLRRIRDEANAGTLTGDGGRERARAVATECDKGATLVSAAIKAVLTKANSEVHLYSVARKADGSVDKDVRDVTTVVAAPAMADLLRAAAALATQASSAEDEEEAEEDDEADEDEDEAAAAARKKAKEAKKKEGKAQNPMDAALEAQARTLLQSSGGKEAAWAVLDDVASNTLRVITGAGQDGGPGDIAADPRANLKLFSAVLTSLAETAEAEAKASGNKLDLSIEATLPVLRTLYATIATCLQIIMGDAYLEAVQAATGAALFYDVAEEEFAGAEARKDDTDVALWTAPTHAARLATSSAEEAQVEDL